MVFGSSNIESSPYGSTIGSYDSSVRVWDCRSRAQDPIQVMSEAKDSITTLQLSSCEILTGCVSNVNYTYNYSTFIPLARHLDLRNPNLLATPSLFDHMLL